MSKVLLTGSTGFIGRNLLDKLKKYYEEIFIPNRNNCNLFSIEKTNEFFQKYRPDYVIHLAGDAGGINYLKYNPATVFDNNNQITSNLFKSCHLNNVKKIIIINSINVYPNMVRTPFKEEDLFKGDPNELIESYGLSKKNCLYYSKFYYQQFGLKSINLICDNVYGPYDNFVKKKSRVIPANIVRINEALEFNKSYINCWGTGRSIRSFIYVDDVCNAIIHFLKKDFKYDFVNLSNNESISIKNLIYKICSILSYDGDIKWDSSKLEGQLLRFMNLDKLKTYNFKPKVDLDEGLKKTIFWYKDQKKSKIERA